MIHEEPRPSSKHFESEIFESHHDQMSMVVEGQETQSDTSEADVRRLSPASSSDAGLDDPICLTERAFEPNASCPQCRELRLKNQELRRIASQKSQMHHDGILLMSSMQKGHNDAISVLHERIKSLEEQISGTTGSECSLRNLQEELSLKTKENLELAAAFEELEGEEREAVSTLKRQIELQARQLDRSRAEARRHEHAAKHATEALAGAKHDVLALAEWLLECEAELASLHKILGIQEDLLMSTQQHLPAELRPYFLTQMENIQKAERRCAAIGRKGGGGPSERVEVESLEQSYSATAQCQAGLAKTDEGGEKDVADESLDGHRGTGGHVPRDSMAAGRAGEWQVRREVSADAHNPWPASPASSWPPSPVPAASPAAFRGHVGSESNSNGGETPIQRLTTPPANHIEPKDGPSPPPLPGGRC